MNLEQRTELTRFLQRLGQVQAGTKDGEAETLIRDACTRQPDATYLLVQRVLQLEHEAQAAKKGVFADAPGAWGRARDAFQPSTEAPVQTSMQQTPAAAKPADSRN